MADDLPETIHEALERAEHGSRLASTVALLVALAATFVALVSVKDRNITLRMDQAQAKAIDTWNYYQAKSMKQNLAEATLDQLTAAGSGGGNAAHLQARVENYRTQIERYEREKGEVKDEAEGYEKKYEALNQRHDLFDLCDAAMSVAIALLGVTALTRKRWLLVVAAVFLATGVFFGLAGFMNWPVRPERAVTWLG